MEKGPARVEAHPGPATVIPIASEVFSGPTAAKGRLLPFALHSRAWTFRACSGGLVSIGYTRRPISSTLSLAFAQHFTGDDCTRS